MTGVPVTPYVPRFPQGSIDMGTGAPRFAFQTCAPVVASKAYTLSCSVATRTRSGPVPPPALPSTNKGCAYTACAAENVALKPASWLKVAITAALLSVGWT